MRTSPVATRFYWLACIALAICVIPGFAQSSYTWNGGGAPDGKWSNGNNWGGAGPANPQAILNFAGSAQSAATNDFTAGSAGHRVFFNSGASSFTLAGNSITFYDFSGNTPKIENSSANLQTVNFALSNGNTGGIEINPVNGDLTLGGSVDNGGYDVNVYGGNSKMLTFSAPLSGTGKLILKQYSKVKISGASTYTGNTEIDTGEFWLGSAGTLTSGSTAYVGNGGQPANTAKLWIESTGTLTNAIAVNSGNYGTRVIGGLNTSGTATFLGDLTLSGPVNLEANQSGGTVVFSGSIGSTNTITKTGPGTVTLSGDMSGFTGAFTNLAGTGIKSGSTAMGGALTVPAGTFSIQNTVANTYSAVNLNGGTLRVKSNNLGLGTTDVTIGGNATLATEFGSSAVTLTNNLTFSGTQTLSIDSGYNNLTLVGTITGSGATLQTTSSGTTTLGGTVNLGTGTLSVPAAQTLTIASPANVTADNVSLAGTTTANILNITGGSLTTKFFNIGNGFNNSGRITQSGGTVTVSAGGNGFRLGHWDNKSSTTNPGSSYTLTGGTLDATPLSANATASAKLINVGWDGEGQMVVGGGAGVATAKAYGIQLDANGNGGGGASSNMTLTVSANGVVEVGTGGTAGASVNDIVILNGGKLKATASSTWSAAMSNAVTSTLDSDVDTATLSGLINGVGGLNKIGAGTVVFSASNSFAGAVTVSNGAVNVQRTNALGTATTTVVSGAELELQGGIGPVNTAVSLNGTGTNNTGALRNISGNNSCGATITLAGATRINSDSGTLTLNQGNLLNLGGNALTLGGAGSIIVSNVAGSAGSSVIKDGAGTVTLSGSYRGSTLGTGTNIVVSAGALQFSSGYFNASPFGFGALNIRVESSGTLKLTTSHAIGGDNVDGGTSWGVVRLAGGKLDVTGDQYVRNGTANSLGRLILDGASIIGTGDLRSVDAGSTISTVASATPSAIACTGGVQIRGTLTLDVADGAAANDLIVSNALSPQASAGLGNLLKSGAGTALLLATNTFTNTTTITAGTLAMGAGGLMTNTPTITVSNGACYDVSAASGYTLVAGQTLKGNGTIVGAVNVVGTLSPGASIGTLTLSNAPTLNGTMLVEIDQSSAQRSDLLTVASGALTYGGNLVVTNIGPAITNGTFALFSSAGGYGGTFASLTLPAGGTAHWKTNNLVVNGTITFTNNNPVGQNLTAGVALGGTVMLPVIGGKHSATDADADALAVTSVGSPTSGGASFDVSNVTYVASGSTGTNTFSYTITDSAGGSDTKTVTVVVSDSQGFNRVGATSLGGNTLALSYLGIPSTNYALDWATNLSAPINWMPVVTNVAQTNGWLYFTNTGMGTDFYRTRYVP